MIVRVDISMELPNVDSIVLGSRDDHTVVKRVEHCAHYRVSMTDKSLEEVRHRLLGIIVPHFEEIILTTCKHIASVV